MWIDRQTDRWARYDKANSHFPKFADVAKNEVLDLGFCVCVVVIKKLVD